MGAVINIISKVPNDIFISAKTEILNINWENLPLPDRRSESAVFKTSITNHLRIHNITEDTPHTIEALSDIIECRDTVARQLYPEVDKLIDWIFTFVNGTKLGRIMIVKLMPGGVIGEHIDPGRYFLNHYRFHVPIITDPNVLFFGEDKTQAMHMPEGYLSQLANRRKHSAENRSTIERIHIIVDIDSAESIYNI